MDCFKSCLAHHHFAAKCDLKPAKSEKTQTTQTHMVTMTHLRFILRKKIKDNIIDL